MSESAYALYTPYKPVAGGKARARTARRDRWGRMLPNDPNKALPIPVNHGVLAGKVRVKHAKRDKKGRFCK